MHVWKYHNETLYFVKLIYANTKQSVCVTIHRTWIKMKCYNLNKVVVLLVQLNIEKRWNNLSLAQIALGNHNDEFCYVSLEEAYFFLVSKLFFP
jgi:hypothetical protein